MAARLAVIEYTRFPSFMYLFEFIIYIRKYKNCFNFMWEVLKINKSDIILNQTRRQTLINGGFIGLKCSRTCTDYTNNVLDKKKKKKNKEKKTTTQILNLYMMITHDSRTWPRRSGASGQVIYGSLKFVFFYLYLITRTSIRTKQFVY